MQKIINTTQSGEWMEGYPLGNGRLASMVWDKNDTDIISLNHEWLWRGVHKNQSCAPANQHLSKVRDTFRNEGCGVGTNTAVDLLANPESVVKVDAYQPAGDICFKLLNNAPLLSRELDIEKGIVTVKRKGAEAVHYVDIVKDVAVSRWASEDSFDAELTFTRPEDNEATCTWNINYELIEFNCSIQGGSSFCVKTEYYTDGSAELLEDGVRIKGASYVNLKSDIGTDVYGIEKELCHKPYNFDTDIKIHSEKFAELMNTVSFNVADEDKYAHLTIEERIKRIRSGEGDNGFDKLYFDYARYLMVSCSALATLPANLQGKWNRDICPPWKCDYHFDINLQMNYWMCEPLGMTDYVEPLVDYLVRIGENSKKGAHLRYGCRGIVMPLSDSAWAEGLPMSKEYGIWTGAAAWMAQHLWWHYTYTGDVTYLKEKAYPFFRDACLFYEDFLEADASGELQFIPSQSPENKFVGGGDYDIALSISSASDVQLCYDVMNYAIESARILGCDDDKIAIWQNILNHLPPFKTGADGRLLEWNEEKQEEQPGHKHLSHLYGVYPGDIFFDEKYKKQLDAARKSFDFRMKHGGGYTGWSRAWVACMYARFGEGELFYEHLRHLTSDYVTNSVLDIHPPRIFQIDGNFGAASAIIEAVVGYAKGKVYLCRAIPKNWQSGSLCGIKIPGGHTVSVYWEDGKFKKAEVCFGFENEITFVIDGVEKSFVGKKREKITIK